MYHKRLDSRSLDLALVAACAILAALVPLAVPGNTWPRIVLTIPLVLILPGYAITAALFPEPPLRMPHRVLLTLSLSIAATIGGGFALNATRWGLNTGPFAALLAGVTILAASIAFSRRSATGGEVAREGMGLRPYQWLLFGLAVVVVGLALHVARTGAIEQPSPGFTQLWLLPSTDGNQSTVRLGIANMEGEAVTYSLRVREGNAVIAEWPALALSSGGTWETVVQLPNPQGGSEPVEALLYRANAPDTVYRRVVLQGGDRH